MTEVSKVITNLDVFANNVSRRLNIFFKIASELDHLISNAFLHLSMMANQFINLFVIIYRFLTGQPGRCLLTYCRTAIYALHQCKQLSIVYTTRSSLNGEPSIGMPPLEKCVFGGICCL